ncbi:MAG: sulfatase-like hydrolase/transferase [Pirellulales bacterium]|nr:sulfatase-like hydrolase/transferase [Pirellulales bacterium]
MADDHGDGHGVRDVNAVVVVVDRLHAGYLGCYGNTWVGTPRLDRLAAESLVCDFATLDRPGIEPFYRACFTGLHAWQREDARAGLLQQLFEREVEVLCLTDEPLLPPLWSDTAEVVQLPSSQAGLAAATEAETQLATMFAAALEQSHSLREPFLFWVHLQGLGAPWDAPYELRARYVEPDEPAPPENVSVPRLALPPDADPDLMLGYSHAYAGQVALLDGCLGAFLEGLRAAPWAARTLLIFTSARGMPLGEHGLIGPYDTPLACELVHIPLLLRLPDASAALARTHALVQPADLAATLRAWWNLPDCPGWGRSLLHLAGGWQTLRDRAFLYDGQAEWAIRTQHWYLRRQASDEGPRYALFVKPDDRWERNDVADRLPEVVETLDTALNEFIHSAADPDLALQSPLPDRVD